ncbi:MAG: septum formation initiator family protein [Patescibacteria group bacterium]
MRKFESQKQIKSRIYSRTTLIILLFIIILLAKGVFTLYLRNQESVEALRDTNDKVRDLKARQQMLSGEITKLNNNDGVEEEIREKFDVTKPGENVVIIVPDEVATTTEEKPSVFARFWHWLW